MSLIEIIPFLHSFLSLAPTVPIFMICDEMLSSLVTLIAISIQRR